MISHTISYKKIMPNIIQNVIGFYRILLINLRKLYKNVFIIILTYAQYVLIGPGYYYIAYFKLRFETIQLHKNTFYSFSLIIINPE